MEYYKQLRQYVGHQPLILPGSNVLILNDKGEILLQEREPGIYGLPGGLMELGESFEDTARREVLEETALLVGKLQLCNVYSGPDYYIENPNGDKFYSVSAVFKTSEYSGEVLADDVESISLQFYPPTQLPNGIMESYRKFIEDALL
ncbi:ADP-ribose pyrophosphatase YjhB, NUDIX family [Psychrobacillus psychrotolerans]|uniref:ADP-ribose pyrophosphatase YjhB, NUDIX family n=1 Tax=Psychrobacillus psychrotolerans TaxID=126156 RepID=A0A1I5Y7T1_9BACI|nr:NUDIX hydrolase [Psychrobacillus psychrotolerans]SFQ39987.1 ADP-ribose pyrophosphatase YjhB, NUDIX family [Psychrobacillus psychrotolerans]